LFPQDLLSFDFKFEGEDDVVGASTPQPSIDLFKQMFSSSALTTADSSTTLVLSPPSGLLDLPTASDSLRVYTPMFLLNVLRLMRSDIGTVPSELIGLTKSTEPVLTTKHAPKFYSDNNWRTVKANSSRTDDNNSGSGGGAWRASGYGQRWNGQKPSNPKSNPPAEEGFW
jgi:hypothetical protein